MNTTITWGETEIDVSDATDPMTHLVKEAYREFENAGAAIAQYSAQVRGDLDRIDATLAAGYGVHTGPSTQSVNDLHLAIARREQAARTMRSLTWAIEEQMLKAQAQAQA